MSPIDVIKIDIGKIQNVGISRQKSGYIKNIANAFDEGLVNEIELYKLSDQEIIDQLVKIKGVGRWTAEMFLIFSLS